MNFYMMIRYSATYIILSTTCLYSMMLKLQTTDLIQRRTVVQTFLIWCWHANLNYCYSNLYFHSNYIMKRVILLCVVHSVNYKKYTYIFNKKCNFIHYFQNTYFYHKNNACNQFLISKLYEKVVSLVYLW